MPGEPTLVVRLEPGAAAVREPVLISLALMDDTRLSTDYHQWVCPAANPTRGLNRWLPLVEWLLAIPLYIVLFVLVIAALVAVIVACFAILVTGRDPRGLFGFVEGGALVQPASSATPRPWSPTYPPFRLAPCGPF